jgi:DNA invertase Pin-like site-specific DNA recombinase
MYYGYHRTSTREQHLDRGVASIERFCQQRGYALEKIYTDQMSGKTFERPRYTVLKEDILRKGDTLIIAELDRLGRDYHGISKELADFREKGVRVMFLDLPQTTNEVDPTDEQTQLMNDFVIGVMVMTLSWVAQQELGRKQKRASEGIEAKKVRGDWDDYGRPRKMPLDEFARQYDRVNNGELTTSELCRELGLNKDTYFRYVRQLKSAQCATRTTELAFVDELLSA